MSNMLLQYFLASQICRINYLSCIMYENMDERGGGEREKGGGGGVIQCKTPVMLQFLQ